MRGHRILASNGKLGIFNEINDKLQDIIFHRVINHSSKFIFRNNSDRSELIIRQYLLTYFSRVKLYKSILYSVGNNNSPIVHPMPSEWWDIIEESGFCISKTRSMVLFKAYVFMLYIYSFKYFVSHIFNSIKNIFRNEIFNINSVYFADLNITNLHPKDIYSDNGNIISWYLNWEEKKDTIRKIFHNVRDREVYMYKGVAIDYRSTPIPLFKSLSSFYFFSIWFFCAFFLGLYHFIKGYWWNSIILNEASKAYSFEIIDKKFIYSKYFFHNSAWIYRPMWSYNAENFGSDIVFYFYSTNHELIKVNGEYPKYDRSCWRVMSWSKYLVWDKYQYDFIKRNIINLSPEIIIVGPIFFSAQYFFLTETRKYVAVFDVTPHRDCRYQSIGVSDYYYIPIIVNKFNNDIFDVLKNSGLLILHKQKRDIGNLIHKKYSREIQRLSRYDCFEIVASNTNVIDLVTKAELVISFPFTSTAIIAKELGKPSIYYDPTGNIDVNDRGAHGVPVISGYAKLYDWVSESLK